MNITWLSGKCGSGKTELVNSIIQTFKKENKKTCKLDGQDFVYLLVKNAKNHTPFDNIVLHFQNCDLLVLDDIDYALKNKPFTQGAVKDLIEKIIANNKTKVILISQQKEKKLRKLKFHPTQCSYIRLKYPSVDFKNELIKEWSMEKNLIIPKKKIREIVNNSRNLFQLKGLFNRITLEKIKIIKI